jgi:hypothetical protein
MAKGQRKVEEKNDTGKNNIQQDKIIKGQRQT